MRSTGYTEETSIRLVQFIDGMTNLSTEKWMKGLEDEVNKLFEEVESVATEIIVRTPTLRKVLRERTIKRVKAEGKAEGKAEEKMETVRRMVARGRKLEDIADATDLSIKELDIIVSKLRSQQ